MDKMLYIIAGLVLISIVAVLFIRKNKGQKAITPPPVQAGNNKVENRTPSKTTSAAEADKLLVAQSFMDQQRYDKAIETLKRGLIQKPNDAQLSLKLLSVYATLNQPEDFHEVYNKIKANNNSNTIAEADELKALLVEEQTQLAAQRSVADSDSTTDFDSLDFDLSKTSHDHDTTVEPQNTVEPTPIDPVDSFTDSISNDHSSASNIDDTFDLTIDDLESSDSDSATIISPAVIEDAEDTFSFDDVQQESLIVAESATVDSVNTEEFSLDFDAPVETNETLDFSNDPVLADNGLENSDEDFVLDFSDVDTDTPSSSPVENASVQDVEDEFGFSLDDADLSDSNADSLTAAPVTDDAINEAHSQAENSDSTTPLAFEETGLTDDSFDFDTTSFSESATADTPVEATDSLLSHEFETVTDADQTVVETTDVETTEDFSARFEADFDFVKTLDSNQVTLDLAGQYLQLGEYDSAKRLLAEVMTNGNSEQQSQAQALLDRTA